MKRLFLFLCMVVSLNAVAQQEYLVPVSVTTGNEQFNTNHGIRAIGGTGYQEARAVVRFTQTISSGESVSFSVVQSNNFYAIGLAAGTSETNVYSTPTGNSFMIFGMLVGADNAGNLNAAIAYQGGVTAGTNTPVAAGNVMRISYVGSTILYQKSTDAGTTFTTFYTSLTSPVGSYYIYFEGPPAGAGPSNIYKTGTVTNTAPVVNAGVDIEVALPITEATLTGTTTDADGTIASRLWTKVSGPAGGSIQSANTVSTQITGLSEGVYVYRLTATDDDGASSNDDVQVTVASADPNGTTVISPTIIPFSDPEIEWYGRGTEDWNGQNYVPIPTEATGVINRKGYYFRWCWKELEPTDNVFSWINFDREIQRAIDRGQTFSFAIMTQTSSASWRTGVVLDSATDGGATKFAMFYPMYMHTLMQALPVNERDWVSPVGDANEWVPNYNAPIFLSRLKRLQDSIYQHIQNGSYNGVQYKNVIDYYDISMVGEYGEWHFNATARDTTKWPTGRKPTIATLDTIISQAASAMNTFKATVQVSVFDARQLDNTWIAPDVGYFALHKSNGWGLLGYRREQFGFADNGASYVRSWTDLNQKVHLGMRFDTAIMNRYKYAPLFGEPPGNWVNTDDPYMKNLPTEVKRYHIAMFGNGNYYTSPMYRPDLLTMGTKDSVRLASKLAGWRLQIDSASMSTSAVAGGSLNLRIYWRNSGVTPLYDKYIVKLRIKNSSGSTVVLDTSAFKPMLFQPSATATPILDEISIPVGTPTGSYSLHLSIEDSLGYRGNLPIANQGRQADGSYQLRSSFQVLTGTSNISPTVQVNGSTFVQLPTTSDTLYASATDPDGTIASYAWTKVSGPSGGTIVSPTASSTRITGLTVGDYVYEVLVTDNSGGTTTGSILITVRAANVAPAVYAGSDQLLYGATAVTFLTGAATDADGVVSTTAWTKVSGPTGGTIATPAALSTGVTGLVVGTYVFRLTATDNAGAVTTDDVSVVVTATQQPRVRVILKN